MTRSGLWGKTPDVIRKEGIVPDAPPVITPINHLPLRGTLTTRHTTMEEVNMDNIADQFKKGYKTSEFWISLLSKAAVIVGVLGFDLDTAEITTLVAVTLGSDTYGGWRTWLKRKRIDAVKP